LATDWQHLEKVLWRRPGERRWKRGTVRLIYNDAHGSVSLYDKHGLNVAVPNTEECLRRRKQ
jgi:hypothetical protein